MAPAAKKPAAKKPAAKTPPAEPEEVAPDPEPEVVEIEDATEDEVEIEDAAMVPHEVAPLVMLEAPHEPDWMKILRAPVLPAERGKLPKEGCRDCTDTRKRNAGACCSKHTWTRNCAVCGGNHSSGAIHLDFMGHAAVTNRLLAADPSWDWEPMALTAEGLPFVHATGSTLSLWIFLHVGGQTRRGVGTCDSSSNDPFKILIGDAIRNAAMRYGVGLELWHKGELAPQEEMTEVIAKPDPPAPAAPKEDTSAAKAKADAKAEEEKPAAEPATQSPPKPSEPEPAPETAPTPAKPAAAKPAPNGEQNRQALSNAFMSLPRGTDAMKDCKQLFTDAGLWPVAEIATDRLEEALAMVKSIHEEYQP